MIKKLSLILLLGLGTSLLASAQDNQASRPQKWDLRSCIEYALDQNITIRQNKLSAESSRIDVDNAKADYLPNISGSISQRIVNRPWSENSVQINGDIISTAQSKTSYSGNYGVDVSWALFRGNRVHNIKQQKVNSEIADLNVTQSENSIIESIVQSYVSILYATDAIAVSDSTLSTSIKNYERGKTLFDVGSMSKADLAQLESQVSQDRYNLVVAQTNLANYKLQLKQLLELDGEMEMDLFLPEVSDEAVLALLPSRTDVYNAALQTRPEIEAAKLNIEASDLAIKAAKSGYLPTVSVSAGIGTSNMNGTDFTFSEQVKRNWNNSLGLSVSIPIFDKKSTKNSIRKAKIQRQEQEISLQDQEKNLYKTIESLWLDANSAQQQYLSAKDRVKSNETSLELVQQQFEVGMKNTIELLTETNNLLSARQEMLQAKYMALMNTQLLKYYAGEGINI